MLNNWLDPEVWKNASLYEAQSFIREIISDDSLIQISSHLTEDTNFREFIMHYFWLFRRDQAFLNLINHPNFPAELALQFIYFGFGKYVQSGNEDFETFFLETRVMLNSRQSYKILCLSSYIDNDPTLKIHLLANLDPKTWEDFFSSLGDNMQNLQSLLSLFENIRENELKSLLFQNPVLFSYLRILMELDEREKNEEQLIRKQRILKILEGIYIWEVFVRQTKEKYALTEEKDKPPHKRELSRLTCIIREVSKIENGNDKMDIITYLRACELILDSWEYDILLALSNRKDQVTFLFL